MKNELWIYLVFSISIYMYWIGDIYIIFGAWTESIELKKLLKIYHSFLNFRKKWLNPISSNINKDKGKAKHSKKSQFQPYFTYRSLSLTMKVGFWAKWKMLLFGIYNNKVMPVCPKESILPFEAWNQMRNHGSTWNPSICMKLMNSNIKGAISRSSLKTSSTRTQIWWNLSKFFLREVRNRENSIFSKPIMNKLSKNIKTSSTLQEDLIKKNILLKILKN